MNIFRVRAERPCEIETLVMSKDKHEARMLTLMAIRNGEIVFDEHDHGQASITSVELESITDKTIEEVKDYGIINKEAEVIYDSEIIEKVTEEQAKQMKEEYLKKYHMEFNFNAPEVT